MSEVTKMSETYKAIEVRKPGEFAEVRQSVRARQVDAHLAD